MAVIGTWIALTASMNPLIPLSVAAAAAIVIRMIIPTPKWARPGIIGDIIAGIFGSLVAAYFYMGAFEGSYAKLTTGVIVTVGAVLLVAVLRKVALLLRMRRPRPQHNHHHGHHTPPPTIRPGSGAAGL